MVKFLIFYQINEKTDNGSSITIFVMMVCVMVTFLFLPDNLIGSNSLSTISVPSYEQSQIFMVLQLLYVL